MGTGALGRAISKAFITSGATVISSYVVDREADRARNSNQVSGTPNESRYRKRRGSKEFSF